MFGNVSCRPQAAVVRMMFLSGILPISILYYLYIQCTYCNDRVLTCVCWYLSLVFVIVRLFWTHTEAVVGDASTIFFHRIVPKTAIPSANICFISVFIRPFEKRTYYAVVMSVCPSVRPSVRPSEFSGLFATCFEISIWNMVYAFSRWHDMSSLSFIAIGSLWPS